MSEANMLDTQEIKDTETAMKYLASGKDAEAAGDRLKAIEDYEAAFAADPDQSEICFRLAYSLDLVGEEEEALNLYEQICHADGAPINALMNLAVIYEDRGQYALAERCLRQVLATDPNHERARLYIKDVSASRGMVIHEDKKAEKRAAMLDTPVTDFDLSVRTRNALRKMSIRTLGDLVQITEPDLRSYKNFGEASIDEIKRMLSQRGLKLGQALEQQSEEDKAAVFEQLKSETNADDALLQKPVNELQLSVRARKALALLNIQSIGELCIRTEAELMGVKNFGMTSLLEIKEKLENMGLGLRKLEK